MVQVRYSTGRGSTHVTDVYKPGMPLPADDEEGNREAERDGLTHSFFPRTMGEAECNSFLLGISLRSEERRTEMRRH